MIGLSAAAETGAARRRDHPADPLRRILKDAREID